MLGFADWERLSTVPSFGRLLMAAPLAPGDLPAAQSRADAQRRPVTRYLVDTNVISAAAPTAAVKRPELIEWMDKHSSALFLSAVTIAEIADGIAKAKREGATRKASGLAAWLRALLHLYGDRVLPFEPRRGDCRRVERSRPRPWS